MSDSATIKRHELGVMNKALSLASTYLEEVREETSRRTDVTEMVQRAVFSQIDADDKILDESRAMYQEVYGRMNNAQPEDVK